MIERIPADARHCVDRGWLRSCYLFSFEDYYDPANVRFGALRVFNDDVVQPEKGFPEHPHREMEIVTIPLSGVLTHTDTSGGHGVIGPGDVQRMSAGTGVRHSEANEGDQAVHLYQIWIFPRVAGLAPSYDQRYFEPAQWRNTLLPLASGQGMPDAVVMHADATIYRAAFEAGHRETFETHSFRRLFFYITEGTLQVEGETLETHDQGRVTPEGTAVHLMAVTDCAFILIDVPPGM